MGGGLSNTNTLDDNNGMDLHENLYDTTATEADPLDQPDISKRIKVALGDGKEYDTTVGNWINGYQNALKVANNPKAKPNKRKRAEERAKSMLEADRQQGLNYLQDPENAPTIQQTQAGAPVPEVTPTPQAADQGKVEAPEVGINQTTPTPTPLGDTNATTTSDGKPTRPIDVPPALRTNSGTGIADEGTDPTTSQVGGIDGGLGETDTGAPPVPNDMWGEPRPEDLRPTRKETGATRGTPPVADVSDTSGAVTQTLTLPPEAEASATHEAATRLREAVAQGHDSPQDYATGHVANLIAQTDIPTSTPWEAIEGKAREIVNKIPKNGILDEKQEATASPSLAVEPATQQPTPKPKQWDGKIRQGVVGDMLHSKQVVTTLTGRKTTPFPNINLKSTKHVDRWLLQNAYDEAVSRGDNFNAGQFKADVDVKKIPQASKDAAEEYLFGSQPEIPRPFLKPLTPTQPQPQEPTNEGPKQTEKGKEKAKAEIGTAIETAIETANAVSSQEEKAKAEPDEDHLAWAKLPEKDMLPLLPLNELSMLRKRVDGLIETDGNKPLQVRWSDGKVRDTIMKQGPLLEEYLASVKSAIANHASHPRKAKETPQQRFERAKREAVDYKITKRISERTKELAKLEAAIREKITNTKQEGAERRKKGEDNKALVNELKPVIEEGQRHLKWIKGRGYDAMLNGQPVNPRNTQAQWGKIPDDLLAYAEPKKAALTPVSNAEEQHLEDGKAEIVTPDVIQESMQESAEKAGKPKSYNPVTQAKELKAAYDYLLNLIDQAILASPYQTKREWKNATENVYQANGYVTLDVPGDGKFKIANYKERLTQFRKDIEKNKGFAAQKNSPSKNTDNKPLPKNPSSSLETAIKEAIDDGETGNALSILQANGKSGWMLANVKEGFQPIIVMDVKPIDVTPEYETMLGRQRTAPVYDGNGNTKEAGYWTWGVYDKRTGMRMTSGDTADEAIALLKKAAKEKPDKVKENKAILEGIKTTQATLEKEFWEFEAKKEHPSKQQESEKSKEDEKPAQPYRSQDLVATEKWIESNSSIYRWIVADVEFAWNAYKADENISGWVYRPAFDELWNKHFGVKEEVKPTNIPAESGNVKPNRFDIGYSLSKEQKKAVIKTLVDVYKAKNAPREQKGFDNNGNERYGYEYSPDLFEKSDITGAMVRYYVTLPDGKIAHPTEIFEGYTKTEIDAELSKQKEAETQERLDKERLFASAKPDMQDANAEFRRKHYSAISPEMYADDLDKSVLLTKDGQFIRSITDKHIEWLLADGWTVKAANKKAAEKYRDMEKANNPDLSVLRRDLTAMKQDAGQETPDVTTQELGNEESPIDPAELKRRASLVYQTGDLEIPGYMAVTDLLAKKDFDTALKIIEQAEKNRDAGNNAAARTEGEVRKTKARGKADMTRLLKLIGAQMYSSNLADVSIKEMVQNSYDAVRASVAKKLETTGLIEVAVDPSNRLIVIRDNGQGMTPKTLRDAFLTVAGSEKSGLAQGETGGGGFGMAKVAFLPASEKVWVQTSKNGTRSTFQANGEDLFSKDFDVEEQTVDKAEHGTTVIIKIPETYDDNGTPRTIWFPSSERDISFFQQPMLNDDVEVQFARHYFFTSEPGDLLNREDYAWNGVDWKAAPMGKHTDMSGYVKDTTATTSWGKLDVYIGKKRIQDAWRAEHRVLSSGIYQFTDSISDKAFEKVPHDIIINVRPTVKADDAAYPFDIKREGWKAGIKQDIEALKKYIINVASGRDAENTVETFKNIRALPKVDVGMSSNSNDVDIASFILQKPKPKTDQQNANAAPFVPPTVTVSNGKVEGLGEDGLKEDKDKEKADQSFNPEKPTPTIKDYLINVGIDDQLPIFHNNTNADYTDSEGGADLMFAELGTLMLAVRDKVAEVGGHRYRALKREDSPYFVGISIDKKYHGVNIVVPFKASLLNPLAIKGTTLPSIVYGLYRTMVHEFTHVSVRNHNEEFTVSEAELSPKLAEDGFDIEMRVMLTRILKKNQRLFNELRDKYQESTTQNIAKSIHEGEGNTGTASVIRADGTVASDQGRVKAGSGTQFGEQQPASGERLSENAERGGTGAGRDEFEDAGGQDAGLRYSKSQSLPEHTFYSALTRSVEQAKQPKAPGQQWKAIIKAMPGVKAEEIEWSDVNNWLDKQTGPVTREALVDYLKGQEVRLDEVELGAGRPSVNDASIADDVAMLNEYGFIWDQNPNYPMINPFFHTESGVFIDANGLKQWAEKGDTTPTIANAASNIEQHMKKTVALDTLPKFAQYTEQGGREGTYRELLLTIPENISPMQEPIYRTGNDIRQKLDRFVDAGFTENAVKSAAETLDKTGSVREAFVYLDTKVSRGWGYTQDEKDAMGVLRAIMGGDRIRKQESLEEYRRNNYTSSHFDTPNIVAHVRFDERESEVPFTPEETQALEQRAKLQPEYDRLTREIEKAGKQIQLETKPLYEKIHQEVIADVKARRISVGDLTEEEFKRYEALPPTPSQILIQELRAKQDALRKRMPAEPKPKVQRVLHVAEFQADKGQEWQKLKKKTDQGQATTEDKARFEFLSSFPMNKTETWALLAFKRVLRYAAENGYDSVTWDTGETSAARYDLSKQIDRVEGRYKANNQYELAAYKGNENILANRMHYDENELPDVIGKELAERLVKDARNEPGEWITYRGLDLKVGGEGMKGFYDQMLPSAISKYVKQWGGKVSRTKVSGDVPAWQVSLTPDMQQAAMAGQVMFAKRPSLPFKGMSKQAAQGVVNHYLKGLQGLDGLKIEVYGTQNEAGRGSNKQPIEAEFHIPTNTLRVIAENHQNPAHLLATLREEIVGHYGLRNLLGKEDHAKVMNEVERAAKASPEFRAQWVKLSGRDPRTGEILNRKAPYFTEGTAYDKAEIADEVISKLARAGVENGWMRRIVDLITRLLRKIGVVRGPMSAREAMALLARAERGLRSGARSYDLRGNEKSRKSFGGEQANLSAEQREGLEQAKGMEAEGAKPKQIWQETGWFKAQWDGKWRFEIDDSKATWQGGNKSAGEGLKGSAALLRHPKAHQAYPHLNRVFWLNENGEKIEGSYEPAVPATSEYFGRSPEILVKGPDNSKRSTGLHETQHAIQHKEDMARGGNPQRFINETENVKRRITELEQWFEKEEDKARDEVETWLAYRNNHEQDIKNALDYLDKEGLNDPSVSLKDRLSYAVVNQDRLYSKRYDEWRELNRIQSNSHYKNYLSLAGEAEARLVQARMDLTTKQRREHFPLDSLRDMLKQEGIDPGANFENLIVRFGDGAAASVPFKNSLAGEFLAPNGQPSNLNPTQWAQVRTPEFKAWFGDWENDPANASKVVDENGEPLVVYHGTYKDFTQFKNKRGAHFGFHFGTQQAPHERLEDTRKDSVALKEDRDWIRQLQDNLYVVKNALEAEIRQATVLPADYKDKLLAAMSNEDEGEISRLLDMQQPIASKEQQKALDQIQVKLKTYSDAFMGMLSYDLDAGVMPVFLSIKNPKRMKDIGDWGKPSNIGEYKSLKQAVESFKNRGFDGVVYKNTVEDRIMARDSFVAFDPAQIKSATGNTGEFLPTNPDIRYSKSSATAEDFAADTLNALNSLGSDVPTQERGNERQPGAISKAYLKAWRKLKVWAKRNSLATLTPLQLVEVSQHLLPGMKDYAGEMSRLVMHQNHIIQGYRNADVKNWQNVEGLTPEQAKAYAEVEKLGADRIAELHQKLGEKQMIALADVENEATMYGLTPVEGYKPLIDIAETKKQIAILNEQIGKASGKRAMPNAKYPDQKQADRPMKGVPRLAELKAERDELVGKMLFEKKRAPEAQRVQDMYDALSPEAKRVYLLERDSYLVMSHKVEQGLVDLIMDSPVNSDRKKSTIAQLRMQFESQRVSGDYFPLHRKGDYWAYLQKPDGAERGAKMTITQWEADTIRVDSKFGFNKYEFKRLKGFPGSQMRKDGNKTYFLIPEQWHRRVADGFASELEDQGPEPGEKSFHLFETPEERDEFVAQALKDGKSLINKGKQTEKIRELDGVSAQFVGQVEDLIGELGNTPEVEVVRDQIWQLYLKSLPELSSRKHMIHRNNTAGYGNDQLLAYSNKMAHDAYGYARLKTSIPMKEVLRGIKRDIAAAESPAKLAEEKARIDTLRRFQNDVIKGNMSNADVLRTARDLDSRKMTEDGDRKQVQQAAKVWADYAKIIDDYGPDRERIERKVNEEVDRQGARVDAAAKILAEDNGLEFASNVYSELQQAHEHIMNPKTSAATVIMNQIGYLYAMAFSPAAWLTNLMQTPTKSMPYVASKMGIGPTTKAFGEASALIFGKLQEKKATAGAEDEPLAWASIRQALSGEEKKAYEIAEDTGRIDNTQAHDLWGFAEQGQGRGSFARKWSWATGFGFHQTERANREITYLASFRLARESGMEFKEAVDYALHVVDKTHLAYSAQNRFRLGRSGVARVAFQFKTYSQGMLFLWARASYQWLLSKSATAEEKAEAKRYVLMQGAVQIAAAGVMGLPIGGLWLALKMALDGDDDKPEEFEGEFRQAMADFFGTTGGRGVSKGLFNMVSPFDMHSRLSERDLFWRDMDREYEGKDLVSNALMNVAGPSIGVFGNWAAGLKLMGEGHWERGLEKLMPKGAASLLKAGRYANEGARTMKGDALIPEFGLGELAGQALGFTPERLADRYEENDATKKVEKRTLERRQDLIDKARVAMEERDTAGLKKAYASIAAYNKAQPERKIKKQDVGRSLQMNRKNRARAVDGMLLDRNLRRGLDERYEFAS
jgi:hypothetical protein